MISHFFSTTTVTSRPGIVTTERVEGLSAHEIPLACLWPGQNMLAKMAENIFPLHCVLA